MYNAETAGEQMGSVCLAEGVAVEQSAAGSGFMADVDVLRRELGLAGQAFEVGASACSMTGVPAEGGLGEQAAACRAALVGGPRPNPSDDAFVTEPNYTAYTGKALHAPAAAQTQVAPAAAQMDRAPAAAQPQVAPAAAQMNRGVPVPIAGRAGPLRLTLASHPGRATARRGPPPRPSRARAGGAARRAWTPATARRCPPPRPRGARA